MSSKSYISVPTCDSGQWTYTTFQTRDEFRIFVKELFKEPGEYKFDDTSLLFNQQARVFQQHKMFCDAPEGSIDYQTYWDTEKEKCRKGVIFKNGKGGVWYLPRFYYHWLNFLQIGGKEENVGSQFPYIWDTQYHITLYEMLAELHGKNSVILKKRQIASSYLHTCKIYNKYLFEDKYVAKMLASKKTYIDAVNGSWKMFNEYHNFNNKETAWACTNDPEKPFSWQQKVETKTYDGRKVKIGTEAVIIGITLDKDPVGGVGGRVHDVFYEEGGVAPTADTTYIYMQPALKQGNIATGMFTIAGSVGELDQCEPLKEFIENPEGNGFYAVETDLCDEHGTKGTRGLFIPEQWSYPPYIDKYGNSDVKGALNYLNEYYAQEKKTRAPDKYQTLLSQGPRNIKEAFAIRTISIFPVKYTARQIKAIEDGEYHIKYVELEYDEEHKLYEKKTDRKPIDEFPLSTKTEDKRGVICIHESPIREAGEVPWRAYYISCDPVEKGKTTTSESLFSAIVYKNAIQVTKVDAEGNSTTFVEGNKIVAWWCGRYDDVNQTNEEARKLIEYYNAYTLIENNKGSLINYLIAKNMVKHIVPKKEIIFDRELDREQNTHDPFGWTKSQALWKVMMEYGVNFLSEELDHTYLPNGNTLKVIYGVSRIPDIMLLREMQAYQEKGNFDRIIAYVALVAFVAKQNAELGVKKITRKDDKLKSTQKMSNFAYNPFKSIARNTGMARVRVNPFKSIK